MTKALVTGGTGFIGSFLVFELLERGYDVRVFDNNFRGNVGNLAKVMSDIDYQEGDIRELDKVKKSLEGIEDVYHLAFINGTENFYKHPALVMEVGIKGHFNLMEAVKNSNVSNFIYASSSEVYQTPSIVPTPESIPAMIPDVRNSRYSYGGSKLYGELLTLHYTLNQECNRKIFRPHNIYGPHMGFEHVIPQIIKKIYFASDKLKNKDASISIQGTGEETRAFCYVTDAALGIVTVAEKGQNREIYHLGKEEEISIIHLIKSIGIEMGVNLKIENEASPEGGTTRRCPDIKKLKSIGYNPIVSLTEGLKKTISWYINYFNKES